MSLLWNKIQNFAIRPSMPQDEAERFRLLNVSSFFWLTFAFTVAFTNLLHPAYLLLGLGSAAIIALPLVLSWYGLHRLSKRVFVLLYYVLGIVLAFLVGEGCLFEWGMLILPSAAYLLSDNPRPAWVYLLFGFVGVTTIMAIYAFTEPVLGGVEMPLYPYFFKLILCTFMLFMIASFRRELERHMKIIKKQNYQLCEKQDFIQAKNEELKQANKKLDRQKAALAKLNEDLKNFTSLASHDMKEPLRTIASFSKILSRKMNKDDENKALFHFIEDAAKRMNNLLESLLQYAHAGVDSTPPEAVDLNGVLEKVKLNLYQCAGQKNAQIVAGNLPEINAHPTFCFQLFQNLLANGIKYSRPDVTPELHVWAETSPKHLILYFEDNGIGISEKDAALVFKPFARLHTAAEYEGSGIGLATCQRIVQRYNGSISLTSELGAGTCFKVELPRSIVLEKEKKEQSTGFEHHRKLAVSV